jgi:hypothetical protein
MSTPVPSNETFEKRWLMFLLHPTDLLDLLRAISNPIGRFAAGALPPDVRIEDVFYDEGENFLGMMLESEFFEPVQVRMLGNMMSASWPRAIFSLNEAPEKPGSDDELWSEPIADPESLEFPPPRPFIEELQDAAQRDFRLRALTFSAENLLLILRTKASRQLPIFPVYPPDTRVLGSVAQEQLGSWVLFLEHPDFEPCKVGQENDLVYVEIPGEGEDRIFRIGLPGAQLKRRLDLNFDDV